MLKGLRNRVRRENEPRVLIVGLDNAGKTTLLNTLGESDVNDDENTRKTPAAPEGPTHGFNIKTLTRGDRRAKLCDLGGQRALREYWQDYYNNTDCIMYVVDSSDHRRLEEAHTSFVDVLNGIPGVPVLVLANKQDLATAKTPQVVAESLHLQESRDRKWHIQGCSAKSGVGLEEGVAWILSVCTS
ncbi:ADP-ribosylation factor-like protein [Trypanosoma cruzi]|uniref:Putative ADP-ribosylation factor-like protein n=1 Tax=Trypanosoma cruzi TaxID=5693 RepID=A0A2V2VN33_TRYCR|nr:putative ADP-ribosylation factor-like protein [Trypanosoma cruzi]PBJ80848.1 ADP-ribosylation factor-like protein [Trypanosoma cruzi cruzi]PWU96628.1 putative ADP-ribosylation factor-like protein [Trypanosoma cruzi]RNF17161.1 ADP-ribosylation factor-like protein [Trypanosoma cruzi]